MRGVLDRPYTVRSDKVVMNDEDPVFLSKSRVAYTYCRLLYNSSCASGRPPEHQKIEKGKSAKKIVYRKQAF